MVSSESDEGHRRITAAHNNGVDSNYLNLKEEISKLNLNDEVTFVFNTYFDTKIDFSKTDEKTGELISESVTFKNNYTSRKVIVRKVSPEVSIEHTKSNRKSNEVQHCYMCNSVMKTYGFRNGDDECLACLQCHLEMIKVLAGPTDTYTDKLIPEYQEKYKAPPKEAVKEPFVHSNTEDFQSEVKSSLNNEGEEVTYCVGDGWAHTKIKYTKLNKQALEEQKLKPDVTGDKPKTCIKCEKGLIVTFWDTYGRYEGSYDAYCPNCEVNVMYEDYSY